jgi:acetyl-CoA C-acetyltransferase
MRVCGIAVVKDVVVTGGFESMSQIPYYVGRSALSIGDAKLVDGVFRDGLHDAYDKSPMGVAAEVCADTYKFSREQQDAYAIASFERAIAATKVRAAQPTPDAPRIAPNRPLSL